MRAGPILFICGILLIVLGCAMLLPAFADYIFDHHDHQVFVKSAVITVFFGGLLVLSNANNYKSLTLRETFLLTSTIWIVIAAFSAIPFCLSELQTSYSDAFFESMSGLTTTGSTVLSGLDNMPPGVLLWRAILQWLGGVGIIVLAIAILPFLRVGGMQLFTTESSDNSGKSMPRTAQIVMSTVVIYLVISVTCAILLRIAGMTTFEAIAHTMTCVSTGGYSTSDGSIGHFDVPAIQWIIIFFMTVCGIPLVFYYNLFKRNWENVRKDGQVFWFLGFLGVCIAAVTFALIQGPETRFEPALRKAAFHVVSLVTTTGFATDDYSLWGPFFVGVFFVLTACGGCTGSTAGGIKVFRFRILYLTCVKHFKSMLSPHGVFIPTYNGRPVREDAMTGVLVFITTFFLSVVVLTVVLAALGIDLVTSLTGSLTAVANVGPGFGEYIGPAGNFSSLPAAAKWVLSFGMMLGRLEFLTVFVLFAPMAWRD